MQLPNWFLDLSKTKRVLVTIAIAAVAYFIFNQIHIRFPIREHKMNEFTQHMQTVCVGRFLIDLPAQASIVQHNQKINDVEIERVAKPYGAWTSFVQAAKEYEQKLRRTPHPKMQSLFKETLRFTPDSFTFVYIEDERTSDLYKIETWLWRERKEFKLIGSTTTNYYKDGIAETRATVTALQLRDNTTLPKEPGACGDGTFFPGRDFRQEYFGITIGLPKYPGFRLGLDTKTHVKEYEEKGLIERFTRSISMPDVVGGVNIKILRSASLDINGQKAEEYVVVGTNVESTYPGRDLRAEMEAYPRPNSLSLPLLSYGGFSASHDGSNQPYPRVMEDDLFLSIWDKALKSIRLRPGAV